MSDESSERDTRFPDALAPGTEVGGYVIHRVLGQGGFGITYEAGNAAGVLSRKVVIKEFFVKGFTRREGRAVVPSTPAHAEIIGSALGRFEAEAQKIVDEFEHPNVVHGEAFLRLNGSAFLVLDFIDGISLGDWLQMRREPPAEREIRRIMEPILDAVGYLHGLDALHRDISPSNIMIRMRQRTRYVEEPVLIDFGAARSGLDVARETSIGPHNPAYCAPEQLARGARLGSYTDIFALGGVLHFLVTGAAPVGGTTRQHEAAITKIDPYPRLADISPVPEGFSPRFLAGIDAALALMAQDRPQSITELKAALGWDKPTTRPGVAGAEGATPASAQPASAQPTAPDPASRPEPPSQPPPPPRGGLKGWMIAAAVVLAAGIGGAGWWVMSGGSLPGQGAVAVAPPARPAPAQTAGAVPAPPTSAPGADTQREALDAAGYDRAKIEAFLARCGAPCPLGAQARERLAAIAADDQAFAAAKGDVGALLGYLSSCRTPCAHAVEASRAAKELQTASAARLARLNAALDAAGWDRGLLVAFLANCGADCPVTEEAQSKLSAIDADDRDYAAAKGNVTRLQAYRSKCDAPCAHRAAAQDEIRQLEAAAPPEPELPRFPPIQASPRSDPEQPRFPPIQASPRSAPEQPRFPPIQASPRSTPEQPRYPPIQTGPATAARCEVYGTSGADKDPWLALRSSPSTQTGALLRVMYDGTELEVLSRSGSWLRVKALDDGREGWAHGSYIRCDGQSAKPAASTCHVYGTARAPKDPWLALRSAPSAQNGALLRVMYDGTKLQVLSRSGSWVRVRALDDGSVGWAHGNYISCP